MKVTSPAIEVFKNVLTQNENPLAGIRVFNNKGCCGAAIQMTISESPEAEDTQTDIDGVTFFLEKDALEILEGVTIHYEDGSFLIEGLHNHDGCCC